MKRTKLKRREVDLVHVIWGPDDQGVVSIKHGWLFYTWAKQFGGHHSLLPTVCIQGSDFALIMDPVPDDPDCFEATWDDVRRLLRHPKFPLMQRIDQGNTSDLLLLKTA
jgi:hypothetical protein